MSTLPSLKAVDAILLAGSLGDVQAARSVAVRLLGEGDRVGAGSHLSRMTLTAALLYCASEDGEVVRRPGLQALLSRTAGAGGVEAKLAQSRSQFVRYVAAELAALDPKVRRRLVLGLSSLIDGRDAVGRAERQNGQ